MFIFHELFSQKRWESSELPTFTPTGASLTLLAGADCTHLFSPPLSDEPEPGPGGADDTAKISQRYKSGLPPPLWWLHIYFPDLPTFVREKEQEDGRQQEERDPTAVLRPVRWVGVSL